MHKQRIWLVVFAVVGVLAAFLPWVDILMSISVTGMDTSQGPVVLGLFGAVLVLAATGARRDVVDRLRGGAIAVLGFGGAVFGVWKYLEIANGKLDLVDAEIARGFGKLAGGGAADEATAEVAGELGRELGRGMQDLFGSMVEVGMGIYAMILAGLVLVIAVVVPTYRGRAG